MVSMTAARQKTRKGTAWLSIPLGAVGGTVLAGTPVGDFARQVLAMIPWPWVPAVGLIILAAAAAYDVWDDGEPNMLAVTFAVSAALLASAAGGKFGDLVTQGCNNLAAWATSWAAEWAGTTASTGLAVLFLGLTALFAERAVKKSGKRGGGR